MKCAICSWCCAVVAVIGLSTIAAAQQEIDEILLADPPSGPTSASQDPLGPSDGEQPPAEADRAAEKSLLEGGLEPTPGHAEHTHDQIQTRDGDLCQCIGETDSVTVQSIEKVMRSPLRGTGIEFADAPLEEIVAVLEDNYGIPIELDAPALDEIGIGLDEPVTISLHKISLRSALRLMLKQLQLTYVIRDEVLIITTPEEAESQLDVCVYDVRDLVAISGGRPTFDSLIDMIIECVSSETWSKNGGGEAEVKPLEPGLLVVAQTQAVQEEIRSLLEAIRKVRRQSAANIEAMGATALDLSDIGNAVVTRYYPLQIPPATDLNEVLMQIRQLITKSLPEQTWNGQLVDGQAVVLAVLPDRVIVRHTPAVQKEVETLLIDSGVATTSTLAGQSHARGGFGGEGGGFFQPQPAE